MEKIVFSHFQPAHQKGVIDLILGIQQGEFQVPITLADQPDLLNIPGVYQQNGGQFWVASQGDWVVGTIALIDAGMGVGALRKMFVHHDFRGKAWGIGQQLWEILLEHARQNHFSVLCLGTIERLEAARRFYERNGWKPIEKSQLPPQFPAMPVDTHFYSFELPYDEALAGV